MKAKTASSVLMTAQILFFLLSIMVITRTIGIVPFVIIAGLLLAVEAAMIVIEAKQEGFASK